MKKYQVTLIQPLSAIVLRYSTVLLSYDVCYRYLKEVKVEKLPQALLQVGSEKNIGARDVATTH